MRFSTAVLTIMAAATTAIAGTPDLSVIPTCALTCIITGAGTVGCSVTDYDCQCNKQKQALAAAVTPCVQKACDAADQAKVLDASNQVCQEALGASYTNTASIVPSAAATGSVAASSVAAKITSAASSAASATSAAAAATSSGAASDVRGMGAAVLGVAALVLVV